LVDYSFAIIGYFAFRRLTCNRVHRTIDEIMPKVTSFKPPYTKNHLFILASVTLLASLFLLYLLKQSDRQSRATIPPSVVSAISAQELKESADLKAPLGKVQQDRADSTWVTDGFVIVDVRPAESFAEQHLVGAQNVPLAYLDASNFNRDVDMVVYSSDQTEIESAINILRQKKVRNIHSLHSTIEELQSQGYQITDTQESSPETAPEQ
jgi:rhodanese-related sulfurtransferase